MYARIRLVLVLGTMLSVAALLPSVAAAQSEEGNVQKFVEILGVNEVAMQISRTLEPYNRAQIRVAYPSMSESQIRELAIEIDERQPAVSPELVDQLVANSVSQFTREELDALIQFYNSPLGMKVAQVSRSAILESVAASADRVVGYGLTACALKRAESPTCEYVVTAFGDLSR